MLDVQDTVSDKYALPVVVNNAKDAVRLIKDLNIDNIKIGVFDLNGILRAKYISRTKFLSALEHGCGFCDVVLGSDIDDQLCANMRSTGWETGYPDSQIKIIPETCRRLPFEPNTLLFLADFIGPCAKISPRTILQNVLNKAQAMGFVACSGFEYEFSVFAEDSNSVRAKNYRDMQPITPGNFGYSMLRSSTFAEFYQDLLSSCKAMDIPLEALHTEIGPGVLEAAIAYDSALKSADKAALFKTMAKIIAARRGYIATFMAKPAIEQQGQSSHMHLSLCDLAGNNVFYSEKDADGIGPQMKSFIAGQQRYLPELLAMLAPTINSYARLVPGHWAPTHACWAIDNRTAALRVINSKPSAMRIEYRVAGADSNPYLVAAAAIASGLEGIRNNLQPSSSFKGNAYAQRFADKFKLPSSLEAASKLFNKSSVAHNWFGKTFVNDYTAKCRWEVAEYAKQVTDWQLARYFELV